MNRRRMILLVATMIVLAVTTTANAWEKRIFPHTSPVSLYTGVGISFEAEFGGLTWPANWDYAKWYVDGALEDTQTIGGQTATSSFVCGWLTSGTHEVKVHAQWNTLGVPFWTEYVCWTVNVEGHHPSASRVSPDSPVTVSEGDTQAFTASATDPMGNKDIRRVTWYLDDEWYFRQACPDFPGEHTWSHTFDTPGEYTVEAVFTDCFHYSSAPGEAVWTVNVIAKRTLTVSSTAGGSVTSPGEGVFEYDEGTEVTVEATPDQGYHFTHWSGSIYSTSNPLYVTIDNDHDATANFGSDVTALYVDDDAPGDPGPGDPGVSDPQEDGTAEHPFDRIQEGIDAAVESDCVTVLAGTYLESIDLRGLAIRLCSADGPEATIINGGGAFHVVQCVSGEGPDTVIEGFSITGGNANGPAPDDLGGGMVNLDSRPTVNNCILSGNLATLGGAGMGNLNSSPVVTNCLFNGNVTVAGIGAGMLNMGGCRPVLTNCTFVGNAATSGHALACDSAGRSRPNNVIITNCILWNGGDEIRCYDSSVLTVAYSDVQGTWPGAGNIAADPVFTLPSVGSWRLWTGSPCIDAGDKTLSMGPSGVWRPVAGTIGGALEFDGVDDCLLSHAMAGTLNGADALTVALWVKSDVTGTDRGFIHFEDPHGTDDRQMRYDASGVDGHGTNLIKIGLTCNARSGRHRGRQQLESSSGVQTTAWQHLAMTWSRGEALKLYINGVLDTPTFNDPGLVGILTGYRKLLIGRGGKYGDPSTDATGWDGLIDDVAVFRRALSAAEVVRLRDQGGASFVGDAGLEGLWELDEWCGCVACDSSGYGRDGWLTSLPATDLDGKTRVLDGDDDGIEAVDMGAYEWEAPPPASGGR